MRILTVFVAAGIALAPVRAMSQEVADGSGKDIPEKALEKMLSNALESFKDPYSLKLYKLRIDRYNESYVCGLYNAKNELGGYTGLRPFRFGLENGMFIELSERC